MSRKNKNFRAWEHQNPNSTAKEAWDAAWASQQGKAYSLIINKLEAKLASYEAAIAAAQAVVNCFTKGHDAVDALADALEAIREKSNVNSPPGI